MVVLRCAGAPEHVKDHDDRKLDGRHPAQFVQVCVFARLVLDIHALCSEKRFNVADDRMNSVQSDLHVHRGDVIAEKGEAVRKVLKAFFILKLLLALVLAFGVLGVLLVLHRAQKATKEFSRSVLVASDDFNLFFSVYEGESCFQSLQVRLVVFSLFISSERRV